MAGGGNSCAVVGCINRTVADKNVHFYHFPTKDPALREVWKTFSRRGSDYKIRQNTVICHEHFDPSCYDVKAKQMRIKTGSIPTIFYRSREKIILTFDRDLMHYVEEETLLNPVYDREKREMELIAKRERKVEEIGKLCRFCFEHHDDRELISITKLGDYGTSATEMLNLIGVNKECNKIFSHVACEECFQQVITIDGYRKRCQKVQNGLLNDINRIDEDIQKLSGGRTSWQTSGIKHETAWDDDVADDDYVQDDSFTPTSSTSPSKNNPVFQEVIIKIEKLNPISVDDDYFQSNDVNIDDSEDDNLAVLRLKDDDVKNDESDIDDDENEDFSVNKRKAKSKATKKLRTEKMKKTKTLKIPETSKAKPKGQVMSLIGTKITSEVAINPKRITNQRYYECFFCHIKFAGRLAYHSHNCQVKELICEVPGCMKTFTALSGFNIHITKLHKLPKITRFYCRICRLSSVTNEEDFREHTRQCERDANKRVAESSITCEVCGKFCETHKGFAIHMMFHKAKKQLPSKPLTYKARYQGKFMCEMCGREFTTPRYLKEHVERIHTAKDENQPILTCDMCGTICRSRKSMHRHLRRVHKYEPVACTVCGKVVRNNTRLQQHMKYHDPTKRIHICPLCPNKKPYISAIDLKRHQESNHGYGDGYQCELCISHYRTKQGLVQHKAAAHGVAKKALSYSKTNF